jgi:hypothetical protein
LEENMKKFALLLTVLALCVSFAFAQGAAEAAPAAQGKVFNIYCWNNEFQVRFEKYFQEAGLVPEGVTVNWVVTPNQGMNYQDKLDEALLSQDSKPADEKVDMFLVEADYALKYVDSPYTLAVVNDIGLTEADIAGQYKYTKDIMTDSTGVLRGVSWQACPGAFIYRRSIAKAVLGSDDPAVVGAALDSWDKFDAVAAEAKAKGYFMLSGFDDDFRVFSDNMEGSWVDANDKIVIDPSIEKWIDQTKTYTDKGYNNKANLWSTESFAGAAIGGKVFGYFGPSWFQDFCLAPATLADANAPAAVGNGSYGDWGLVMGPQGFSWGGTWICGAKGSDNIELVKAVMEKLTCDSATLKAIAQDFGDFTNNEKAMEELANSDLSNAFLGGQNHIAILLDSAKSISRDNISAYDQGMTEKIQAAFADYFNGIVTKDQAYANFYTSIIEKYPNLSK